MKKQVPSIETLLKAIPALPKQQRKVMASLMKGKPLSVAEMAATLWLCDPRAVIRELRAKGYPILDQWRRTETARYKVYFIDANLLATI